MDNYDLISNSEFKLMKQIKEKDLMNDKEV